MLTTYPNSFFLFTFSLCLSQIHFLFPPTLIWNISYDHSLVKQQLLKLSLNTRTVDRNIRFRDQGRLGKQGFTSAAHLSGQRAAWDHLLCCLTPALLTWPELSSGTYPQRSSSSSTLLFHIESIIRKPLFTWDLTAQCQTEPGSSQGLSLTALILLTYNDTCIREI